MVDSRMAAALKDPNHQFTRTEIAYLMSVAYRWGYEHRVDEENGAWPPDTQLFFNAGETVRLLQRKLLRDRLDREAREQYQQQREAHS